MAVRKVVFLLIVLLVFRVQHVACPTDSFLLNMDTTIAQCRVSPPLPQPQNEDPCQNHTVSCNPATSLGAKIVIWVSALISFSLFFSPIARIRGLQPGHCEANTLFWWFLCIGSAGNGVWWSYFSDCFHSAASVLPILLANISGFVINIGLTRVATRETTTPGDKRHHLIYSVPCLCFMAGYGLKNSAPVEYTGWFGFALTGLSQSFRIASSLSFFASVLGSVGGCLWTIHPQLCVSREYKITSYVVAIARGIEAIIWCSGAIARQLRRLEGQDVVPPEDLDLPVVV